jgi:hypothetical protein
MTMRHLDRLSAAAVGSAVLVLTMGLGCGSGSDEPYKPAPAWSGRKASIPAVPQLPSSPIKAGDAYTVYGAIHHLNSRIHNTDVTAKDITIQGYIVQTNFDAAPQCAIHKVGKKDPDDCGKDIPGGIPIPSFWISDNKGDTKGPMIRVLGWAKNFATVFEAMNKYKNLKDPPKELYKDEIWMVDVPFPLPSVGAKVKITGKYGYTFMKSSTGLVADPKNGVMTYGSILYVEPAPEPAAFAKKT